MKLHKVSTSNPKKTVRKMRCLVKNIKKTAQLAWEDDYRKQHGNKPMQFYNPKSDFSF